MSVRRLSPSFISAACALAATMALASTAQAQTQALALERWVPAPAGDRMYGVQSPFVAGEMTPHVMLLVDYAHNPLVLRDDRTGEKLGPIVENQLFLHLNGGIALFNRVNLNVSLPVALLQDGGSPKAPDGVTFTSPSSAQLGDLRLGVRINILGDYHDLFQAALSTYLWLPTGSSDPGSYVSDGSLRGLPQLVLGGREDRFVWSAAVGPEFRSSQVYDDVPVGTSLHIGVGLGYALGEQRQWQVGAEASVATVITAPDERNANLEVLASLRYRVIRSIELGAGVGPGVTDGIGTPDVRGVFSVAYTPEVPEKAPPPPPDRDKDTIADGVDACPDVAGVADADPAKNGCPPPKDTDKDGIIDESDACINEPGPANADATKNGCPLPPDRDKDGIIDAEDACPDLAGVASKDAKKNGCPPDKDDDGVYDKEDACVDYPGMRTANPETNGCPGDSDSDTIRDDKDACPFEKGKPNADATKNGCPVAVRVTESEIIILQQVQFDTAMATIRKVSDPLLDEVAEVLKEHPEILKLEVQGHTDNKGVAKVNAVLSQNRADAVVKALVKRGVEAGRMTSKGYGQTQPIDTNDTDAGRQKNRRVQFKIVEKKPKAPAIR